VRTICLAALLALITLTPDAGRAEPHADRHPAGGPAAQVMAAMASGHARSRRPEPHRQGSGHVQLNAIGLAVRTVPVGGHGDAGRTPVEAGTIRVLPAAQPAPAIAHATVPPSAGIVHRPAGITGTGVVRPGAGPATIGGAGVRSTSVNGTAVRVKR